MEKERIEIQLLHEPKISTKPNSFGVLILIDEEDVDICNLNKEQLFHITSILLNAVTRFIDIIKVKNDDNKRKC